MSAVPVYDRLSAAGRSVHDQEHDVGSNRRYAASIDRQMDRRIIESVMADHAPETLKESELELDTELLVRPDRAVPCTARVRYNGVPISVRAEAVAWTPHAVAIRWKTPTDDVHKAWVWASAVRRGGS